MQTKPLRYGYVGAGFVARFHLSAIKQIRGIELTGVTAPKGAQELAAMAKEMGVGEPTVFSSIREMAEHTDCIAIFAPNATRIPVVEEIVNAVKSGAELKGVICEKPLGRNIAEARRLVELAESVNLRTAYFENQIFMKPLRTEIEQLELVQKQMGPFSLSRSAEEHGGPHEGWFWDPTQQCCDSPYRRELLHPAA